MRFGVGRVTPFGATTSGSLKSELAKGRLGVHLLMAMVTGLLLVLQTAWKAWKPQTSPNKSMLDYTTYCELAGITIDCLKILWDMYTFPKQP